jgi:hypothetical protein
MNNDILIVAEYCKANLDLNNNKLPSEYSYSCLPLCVIDAVYSIGVNYKSTQNTVKHFCDCLNLTMFSDIHPPKISDQISISQFLELFSEYGSEQMASVVFNNLQRTSSRNGILKAEAVKKFSETLLHFSVEYFQDLIKISGDPEFEYNITNIPGQHSGISLTYFHMLSGDNNNIKPDRMIIKYLFSILGRYPNKEECITFYVLPVKY